MKWLFTAYDPFSYYLKWKKDEMYVVVETAGKIIEEMKVTDFFEVLIASDKLLLELKERIPGFIEYIGTRI